MKVLEAQRPVRRHNLTGLIRIINRWKFLVLGVTLAAAIISIVVAKMLPNEYKSTAVFLPLNFSSVDPDRIVAGERLEIASTNEDIDRMITVGESHILADYIIKKYDLYKHYGIDKSGNDESRQLVLEEFMSHYSIEQNPRDAIEVSYIDEDKNFAANVANDIVNYIDTLNQQLSYENRKKALDLHKNNFDFLGREFNTLRDSVYQVRKKYGTINLNWESRYLAERLVQTESDMRQAQAELEVLSKNYPASHPEVIKLKARVKGLETAFTGLTTKGGNTINQEAFLAASDYIPGLESQLKDLTDRYNNSRTSYENIKMALAGNVSTIYLVQKAYPPTKKAKPVRWLIVASSTLLTFFISVFLVAIFELYRREIGFDNA